MRAVLTDIEGTTTDPAFVTATLFPYARARLAGWVAANGEEAAPMLASARALAGEAGLDDAATVALLEGWIDADVKATPLKAIQGRVWADGYASGAFQGHVYPDAAAALRRWAAAGVRLHVYSSGSVEAQRLLFRHSDQGDLEPLFAGWFDTTSGPKREAASYTVIARAIGGEPGAVHFLSDTPEEVAAARAAGMRATLVDRSGATSGAARTFEEIES